jgi:hypothetical protein
MYLRDVCSDPPIVYVAGLYKLYPALSKFKIDNSILQIPKMTEKRKSELK